MDRVTIATHILCNEVIVVSSLSMSISTPVGLYVFLWQGFQTAFIGESQWSIEGKTSDQIKKRQKRASSLQYLVKPWESLVQKQQYDFCACLLTVLKVILQSRLYRN